MTSDLFYESEQYEELCELARKLEKWDYTIGSIKWYTIYVLADGINVFDIWMDEVNLLVEDHVIPDETLPIIQEIQEKLKDINACWEEY